MGGRAGTEDGWSGENQGRGRGALLLEVARLVSWPVEIAAGEPGRSQHGRWGLVGTIYPIVLVSSEIVLNYKSFANFSLDGSTSRRKEDEDPGVDIHGFIDKDSTEYK